MLLCLEKEKADVEDEAVMLDMEKELMAVVVGDRFGEMLKCGVRILDGKEGVERRLDVLRSEQGSAVRDLKEFGDYSHGVEKERDALKVEVEVRSREVDLLKEKVAEILERESTVVNQLRRLTKDNEALVKDKNERDAMIESQEKEANLLNESLVDALAYCENLKEHIGGLVMEKQGIELERNESLRIVEQLVKEVCGLWESVLVLQAELQRLREMVSGLDKGNAELMQQRDGLTMEFAVLKEQNKGNEEQIRSLLLEQEILTRSCDESATKL